MVMAACLGMLSCKKDGMNPLTDYRPDVPVTVANVYDYRPAPTVKASKAENKITITLQIPASSGRTIKEITKVAASTSANFTVIQSSSTVGTTGLYLAGAISASGTSVTFTTTFDEYKVKTGAATPASNALLGRDFYFLLTLDNGQTLIPQNTRVWVVD